MIASAADRPVLEGRAPVPHRPGAPVPLLARRLGWRNAYGDAPGRYPKVTPDQIAAAGVDLVLLPDEPYVFTADDGPEAFTTPTRLVSGRLLTWYGPAMVEAHAELSAITG